MVRICAGLHAGRLGLDDDGAATMRRRIDRVNAAIEPAERGRRR